MKENYRILLIFLFALVVFSAPSLLRWYYFGNPTYIGEPTVMHARISQYIIDGTFNWYDPLSYGGREYTYPPLFSFCMAFLGLLIGLKFASVLFVSLFGAAGVVAVYLIAKKYMKEKYATLSAIILIFIPGTVFANSHISTRAPGIALGLAALYILMRKNKPGNNLIVSAALLGISFLFHPEPAMIFLIIIFAYFLASKQGIKNFGKILLISVAIGLLWYGPFLLGHGFPEKNTLYDEYRIQKYSLESPTIDNYFWELQNKGVLNATIILLAILGFLTTKNRLLGFWVSFAFVLTLIFERFFIYLPFPAAIFTVFGLIYLEKKMTKRYFYIIAAAALIYILFFGAQRAVFFANDYPIKQHYEAFTWIKNNTPENATILSDWQWGHWIAGIAERKNFMDGYVEYAPDVNGRFEKLNKFYADCSIPEGYGIDYIYMEDWFSEKRNITCLSRFSLVFEKDGIKVYKV